MKTLHLSIIVISVVAFVILIPIIPLMHSNPSNVSPNSYMYPEFSGSITRALFQCGIEVSGIGTIGFICAP